MRLLLVEDEHDLADALCAGLSAEGHAVDVTGDGHDGLQRALAGSYDVIILDILLPGLNGYLVCRELRAAEDWTPILMLTAKDGEWDEAEALDTGADDYLTKPFSLVVLHARLRALARRGARERPAVLTAADLHLDPATRRCSRGTEEVLLTPREYAVLELLLRRRGTVVTRAQLLDHVWGMDFEGHPGVIDVYIGYLREKIDRGRPQQLITTVRGVGFRLAADA